MSEKPARKPRWTSPVMPVAVHCLVVPFLGATGDDGQPVDLLPCGRLTTAILPIVGRATRATRGGADLGGSVVSEEFGEAHGETIHRKNKSAMPEIILDKRPQCRQSNAMKMTKHEQLIGTETMKSRIEFFHADRLKRIGMEWKIDFFRTSTWSCAKILKEFRALPENADTTPGRAIDFEVPQPKSASKMAEIMKGSLAALIG